MRVQEGESVVGYKVGCTGEGTINLFGMKGPVLGTLFDKKVLVNDVELDPNSFCSLAFEAEMAIKFGEKGQILSFPIIINLSKTNNIKILKIIVLGLACGI